MINWFKNLFRSYTPPQPQAGEVKKELVDETIVVSTVTAAPSAEPVTITVKPDSNSEVSVTATAQSEVPVKKSRKPRSKKVEAASPLPQTVKENVESWPFPTEVPAEGAKKRGRKKKEA